MRISDWSSDVCSSDLAIFRLCRAGKGEAKIGFIAFNWRGMKISRLPEKLRCGRCRETGHRDCCQGQIPGHPVDVHNCPSGHYCHYSSASESTSSSVLAATLLLSDVSAVEGAGAAPGAGGSAMPSVWTPSRSVIASVAVPSTTSMSRMATDCSLRSEEHTSELKSLMRISYAVFCLKKKKTQILANNQT